MTSSNIHELLRPFCAVFFKPSQQWHPLVVHFPLVFLTLEAVLVLAFWRNGNDEYERWAYRFLHLAFWTMLIAAVAGLHDSGLNLGPGNKIWLGLQDRWQNRLRFQSSVTVHVWLALSIFGMTLGRLLWRWRKGVVALRGRQAFCYGALMLFGLWCLMAASYAGGIISHP